MAVTWAKVPPSAPDLTSLEYSIWKFRQKAGLSQQDETYEGCLSDEEIEDLLIPLTVTVSSIDYYQPLTALAWFIRSNPEERHESREGDAQDKWTSPYQRADSLVREQELNNRNLIPGYTIKSQYLGPVLTRWDDADETC